MKKHQLSKYLCLIPGLSLTLACSNALADIGPSRIIIKLKDNAQLETSQQAMIDDMYNKHAVRIKHLRRMALAKQHVFKADKQLDKAELANLLNSLSNNSNIEFAEEDKLLKANFTPNDSRYNEQWQYFEATGGINMPAAWDKSTGTNAVVAVVDTGYVSHSDLDANILPGYDFISDTFVSNDGDGRDSDASDPGDGYAFGECGRGIPGSNSSWHGTHVSGTVAAVTDNNLGVAGIAFNASVLPVRVLGKCGGFTSDIADGVIWASGGSVSGVPDTTTPAQVINMSLGGGGACGNTMQNAINAANANGTSVVVAAGNENMDAANSTPANCNGVITVAANDRNGDKAWYSNFGSTVEIAAPGGDTSITMNGILSTLNEGTQDPAAESYEFYQGTSMAAPHVAGVAALLYAANSELTPQEVSDAITSTARAFPGNCPDGCGAGIVDASAAIDAVTQAPPPPPVQERLVVRNMSGARLSWTFEQIHVLEGASALVVRTTGGTGDIDLYVKLGSQPTAVSYDCRAVRPGNEERCIINNPAAGDWFIGVRGRQAYSGVDLIGIVIP